MSSTEISFSKQAFRVFDAVNLHSAISKVSEMKPVVNKPDFSFSQLVGELETVQDSAAIASIIDELLAKLQRKKRSLRHASLTLSDDSKEAIEMLAGMPVEGMVSHLRESSPSEATQWLRERCVEKCGTRVWG